MSEHSHEHEYKTFEFGDVAAAREDRPKRFPARGTFKIKNKDTRDDSDYITVDHFGNRHRKTDTNFDYQLQHPGALTHEQRFKAIYDNIMGGDDLEDMDSQEFLKVLTHHLNLPIMESSLKKSLKSIFRSNIVRLDNETQKIVEKKLKTFQQELGKIQNNLISAFSDLSDRIDGALEEVAAGPKMIVAKCNKCDSNDVNYFECPNCYKPQYLCADCQTEENLGCDCQETESYSEGPINIVTTVNYETGNDDTRVYDDNGVEVIELALDEYKSGFEEDVLIKELADNGYDFVQVSGQEEEPIATNCSTEIFATAIYPTKEPLAVEELDVKKTLMVQQENNDVIKIGFTCPVVDEEYNVKYTIWDDNMNDALKEILMDNMENRMYIEGVGSRKILADLYEQQDGLQEKIAWKNIHEMKEQIQKQIAATKAKE